MKTRKIVSPWVMAAAAACFGFLGCGDDDNDIAIDSLKVVSTVTDIAPGDAVCPAGGQRIDAGIDKNSDGQLSSDEIASTSYVCTGADALVIQKSDEPAGPNCANGGIKVESGYDADGDGALTGDEVRSTEYICGAADQLTVSLAEPAGTNCEFGGIRVDVGNDADGDGALSAAEITSTSYVCYDESDANALSAAALTGALDNLLPRLLMSTYAWSGMMDQRASVVPHSPYEEFCAATEAYTDVLAAEGLIKSSALPSVAALAQEIREGRLSFDAAAFNQDFAFLKDGFKLCSGGTLEALLGKMAEIGLPVRALAYITQAPPPIVLEEFAVPLLKKYLHGTVADGGACYFDQECAGVSSGCLTEEIGILRDQIQPIIFPTEKCSPGFCVPMKAAGESCIDDSECLERWCLKADDGSSEQGTCTAETDTYNIGDACGLVSTGHFVSCIGDGLTCVTEEGSEKGTCVYGGDAPEEETVGLGGDCTDYGCDAGLWCKQSYDEETEDVLEAVCVKQAANGEACTKSEECVSDWCVYESPSSTAGTCVDVADAQIGEACGLLSAGLLADCADYPLAVCLYPSGKIEDYEELPTEKGVCVSSMNLGKAVGEKCASDGECLDGRTGITACLGPDRTALTPDAEGLVDGTCQYVGDIGDKCSNAADPEVMVCKRPLECNNETGLCQELPSQGTPSENYPFCNPLDSIISGGYVLRSEAEDEEASACIPLLDNGEAIDPDLPPYSQCKSHYAANGICIESPYFYEMVSQIMGGYQVSSCELGDMLSDFRIK